MPALDLPLSPSPTPPPAVLLMPEAPARRPHSSPSDLLLIEGIGPATAARLRRAGVHAPADLLDRAGTRFHRRALAALTGIPPGRLRRFAAHADLMRTEAPPEYAELLDRVGVRTVAALARQNPALLRLQLLRANTRCPLVHAVVEQREVGRWVRRARALCTVLRRA